MPRQENQLLRVLVPILAILGALGIAYAVFRNSGKQVASTPATPTPAANMPAASSPAAPATAATSPATTPASTPPTVAAASATEPPPSVVPAPAPVGLRAVVVPRDIPFTSLGSLDRASGYELRVDFSPLGAGVAALRLTNHFESIRETSHTLLQGQLGDEVRDATGAPVRDDQGNPVLSVIRVTPFAALNLEINGGVVDLGSVQTDAAGRAGPVWREIEPGRFEAVIVDDSQTPIVRVERHYRLDKGSFDLELIQRVHNLTAAPLTVRWYQLGPSDLPPEPSNYGGDRRTLRFGYLLDLPRDPSQQFVQTGEFAINHQTLLGHADPSGRFEPVQIQWPNATATAEKYTLVWAALTGRHFGVNVHPVLPPLPAAAPGAPAPLPTKSLTTVERIERLVYQPTLGQTRADLAADTNALRLVSPARTVAPGSAADLSLGIFAGPNVRSTINSDPQAAELSLAGMIVYNMGGPCWWCTFAWITDLLLGLLTLLHNYVFFDWGLAIIFLVVVVRTCLHPVTKWSQIRMQRFGKQMQEMAPKQQKIREKYKDDPKKMQEETARLWREEGVNPLGMLGCLPILLQSPIWFALYAVLFLAAELRHQPAFYGLFQAIQPSTSPFWYFLGDLAEPDRFWYFGTANGVHVPLISWLMGPIASLNLVPIILGFVFFAHQKYLTPPSTAQLTPEQEMQQKMVKWMSVIMFPLFMYNAPAGLSLYFVANSTFAIIENKWIRAHMTKYDLLNVEKMKQERMARQSGKQPGFFRRMQELAAQQAAAAERARQNKR